MKPRRVTVLSTAALVASAVSIALWAWLIASPQYWFPSAYEEPVAGPQGTRGVPGPPGERGPRGPIGPPGLPTLPAPSPSTFEDADTLADLASRLSAVEGHVGELGGRVDRLCENELYARGVGFRPYWLRC